MTTLWPGAVPRPRFLAGRHRRHKDAEDDFRFTIQEQIMQAADSADIICVVVETDVPVIDEDRKVAKLA